MSLYGRTNPVVHLQVQSISSMYGCLKWAGKDARKQGPCNNFKGLVIVMGNCVRSDSPVGAYLPDAWTRAFSMESGAHIILMNEPSPIIDRCGQLIAIRNFADRA